jgi:hypothetical protein
MVSPTEIHWRELARTTGNGVEATLLWDESINRVKVAVSDGRLCHHVDFEIAGGDALKAFHRPFAAVAAQLPPATDVTDKGANA